MARQEGQKAKIIALLQIFGERTDEEHRLSVPQLAELLEREGIRCERKSIYTDIEALNDAGYHIVLRRGRGGGYCMCERHFELAELKLLVDAVQSSRFITRAKSAALIRKLEYMTSQYQAGQLQRQVFVAKRIKNMNESVYGSVDALHTAIDTGRKVSFRYTKSGKNGLVTELRTVSPWQLAWDNGYYYLIAYQEYHTPSNIRCYRVDRMSHVKALTEARCGKAQFENFDVSGYLNMMFGMFGGDKHTMVTLQCDNTLADAMRDRFGELPIFLPEEDGEHFHFDVPVFVSTQFYGWVCGFGDKLSITAPETVRTDLAQFAQSLAARYSAAL